MAEVIATVFVVQRGLPGDTKHKLLDSLRAASSKRVFIGVTSSNGSYHIVVEDPTVADRLQGALTRMNVKWRREELALDLDSIDALGVPAVLPDFVDMLIAKARSAK